MAVALVYYLLNSAGLVGGLPSIPNNAPEQPTPNITALMEWTPTPDAPDQVTSLIKTVWPTPVTRVMPADREAFRTAFLEKLTARSINWGILSSINHAGVAWRCEDITAFGASLPDSTSSSLAAVWDSWLGGVDYSTMQISVEDGGNATPINNVQENTVDIYKKAVVIITFPDFGVVGPETLPGNEVIIPIDRPSVIYNLWTAPRGLILHDDLITEKQRDNVNAVTRWAHVDSIAPLQKDGTRDAKYLKLLYDMAAASLLPDTVSIAMPNGDTATIDHSLYDILQSVAKDAAVKAGYAEVESFQVHITAPQNLSDFHRLANPDEPVVPVDIATQMADSTCPQIQLESDSLNSLAYAGLSDRSLNDILSRLLETVWAK